MKINTYKCDSCGIQKGDTNHWILVCYGTSSIEFHEWHDSAANDTGIIVEHICSESCAGKVLSKWLANRKKISQPEYQDKVPASVAY